MTRQALSIEQRSEMLREAARLATDRLSTMLPSPLEVSAWALGDGSPQQLAGGGSGDGGERVLGAVFACHQPPGFLLIGFPSDSARTLVALADGARDPGTDCDDERLQSILTELANIFAGSFLSSLADRLDRQVDFGSPGFVDDMYGAIVDGLVVALAEDQQAITRADLMIRSRHTTVQGHLTFLGRELLWKGNHASTKAA